MPRAAKQKAAPLHYRVHQMSDAEFEQQFPDETACRLYLQRNRLPNGVVRCPRCGNDEVHPHSGKPHHWNCYVCSPDGVGYRFSVLVGTIFQNTNKPLRQWFRVMHLMLTSKKGISALQIFRYMGFGSYKTALGMCNKIRVALGNEEFKQLIGYVEVDETFVGGKAPKSSDNSSTNPRRSPRARVWSRQITRPTTPTSSTSATSVGGSAFTPSTGIGIGTRKSAISGTVATKQSNLRIRDESSNVTRSHRIRTLAEGVERENAFGDACERAKSGGDSNHLALAYPREALTPNLSRRARRRRARSPAAPC